MKELLDLPVYDFTVHSLVIAIVLTYTLGFVLVGCVFINAFWDNVKTEESNL